MATGITFFGLDHYAGLSVDVWLAGLDCGTYTVAADGHIFVPYGADPDGFLSATFLSTVSSDAPSGGWPYATKINVTISGSVSTVTVPCIIGGAFVSQGQTLRPAQDAQSKTPIGNSFGMTRRPSMYSITVVNTVGAPVSAYNGGISIGVDFNNLRPVEFTSPDGVAYNTTQMFSGVWWDTIDGDYDFDGMIAWQISRPYPATVTAVSSFTSTAERLDGHQ